MSFKKICNLIGHLLACFKTKPNNLSQISSQRALPIKTQETKKGQIDNHLSGHRKLGCSNNTLPNLSLEIPQLDVNGYSVDHYIFNGHLSDTVILI
jgi:hypothetical protein